MLTLLLWIVSAYMLCMLAVHVVHTLNQRRAAGPAYKPVVIITHNQQHQVEWVLRSVLFCNWLKGRHVQLMVIDTGSSDLTVKIVQRLAMKTFFEWEVVKTEAELQLFLSKFGENVTILDLNKHTYHDVLLACN